MSLLNITNNVLNSSKNAPAVLAKEKILKETRQKIRNELLNDKKSKIDISHIHLPGVMTLRGHIRSHPHILTEENKTLQSTKKGSEKPNIVTTKEKSNISIEIPKKKTEAPNMETTKRKSKKLIRKKKSVEPKVLSIKKNTDQLNVELPKKDIDQPNIMKTKRNSNISIENKKIAQPSTVTTKKKSNIPIRKNKIVEPISVSTQKYTKQSNMSNISIRKKKTLKSHISPSGQINQLTDLTSEQKVDELNMLTSEPIVMASKEKTNEPNILVSKKKTKKLNTLNLEEKIKIVRTPKQGSLETQKSVIIISSSSKENTPNNVSASIKKVKRKLNRKVIQTSKDEVDVKIKKQKMDKVKKSDKIVSQKSRKPVLKVKEKSSTDHLLLCCTDNTFQHPNSEIQRLSDPASILPLEACKPSIDATTYNFPNKKIKRSKIKRKGISQHNTRKVDYQKQELKKVNNAPEAYGDVENNSPKGKSRNTFERSKSIRKKIFNSSCSEKIIHVTNKTVDKANSKHTARQRECTKRSMNNVSEDFQLNDNIQKQSGLSSMPPNTFATTIGIEEVLGSIISVAKRTKQSNRNPTNKSISNSSTKNLKKSKNSPKNQCKPQEEITKTSDLFNIPPEGSLPNAFETNEPIKDLTNCISSRKRTKRTKLSPTQKPLSKHSAKKEKHSKNSIEDISQHVELQIRELPDTYGNENTPLETLEPIENIQNDVKTHKNVRRTKKNQTEKAVQKYSSRKQKNLELKSLSSSDFPGNSSDNTSENVKQSLCSNGLATEVSTIPEEQIITVNLDLPSDVDNLVEVKSPIMINRSIANSITLDDVNTEPEMTPIKKPRKYKKRVYKYVAKTLAKRGRPRKQPTETVVSDPVRAYMNLLPPNKIALNNFNPFEIEEVNELRNATNLDQCLLSCDSNEAFS